MQYLLRRFAVFPLICLALFVTSAAAQTIPVGSLQDEQMKIQALLADSAVVSPVLRPFSIDQYNTLMDVETGHRGWWNRKVEYPEFSISNNVTAGLLPVSFQNTLNSRFPLSENNAAAWYGRGHNTEWQAGFYIRSEYVTATFYPHFIYQENKDFLEPRFFFEATNPYVNEIGGNIDAPFRFGPDPYTTFDMGNSSIRLHYGKFETGLSTEPLWWGGANRYPLMMSNNAPGVNHFFLGTRERVRIPYLGLIHFKWVLGYPDESDYFGGEGSGETRFMNAANLAYSPAFFENFTIGISRAYHFYQPDGLNFQDIFVLFDPVRRSSLVEREGDDDVRQARNQMVSLYFHLSLPAANAEIYAEFFRDDHSFNFRDLLMQPHHNSAYSLGFQKISHAPWFDFVKTNLEFTNLTATQLNQVRPQTFFYSHDPIIQGHTNRGHILGAAIGPGSNSQFFSIDGYKDDYKIGLFVQRLVVNDNLHFREGSTALSPFREFGDYYRHWVNLNAGVELLYGPGPFYINGRLTWTKAYNYGRFDTGDYNFTNWTEHERNDRTNIQMQIGISYIF